MKTKVKDIKAFVRSEKVLYATGSGSSKLFVSLHAGPCVERYTVVTKAGEEHGFTNAGDAVRVFNKEQE